MSGYKIYKKNIVEELECLSSYDFQKVAWFDNDKGLSYSFNDNVNDLFDDFYLEKALYDNVIVFGKDADQALRELNIAVSEIDGDDYTESELIDLPQMQIIREKAAKALALVQASDGSESTVEIVE